MTGESAVTSMTLPSTYSWILSRLSSVPSTEYSRNLPQPSARIRAECRKLLMITGRIALSSKFALAAREGDRVVVAHHLDADHHHRLALRGIDLAGHDRRAWLVAR